MDKDRSDHEKSGSRESQEWVMESFQEMERPGCNGWLWPENQNLQDKQARSVPGRRGQRDRVWCPHGKAFLCRCLFMPPWGSQTQHGCPPPSRVVPAAESMPRQGDGGWKGPRGSGQAQNFTLTSAAFPLRWGWKIHKSWPQKACPLSQDTGKHSYRPQ